MFINASLMPWIWLGLVVLFGIIEAVSLGLVSIWFAAGAVAALLTSVFTPNLAVQGIVFVLVTTLTLIFTRPLVKKYRLDRPVETNAGLNVGRIGVVVEPITPELAGRVRLDGVDWTARADVKMEKDDLCVVLKVEGAKLHVEPEKQPAVIS